MCIRDRTCAKEVVADAFAHLKFIGSVGSASALLDAAQVPDPAAGVLPLTADSVQDFVTACMGLREWARPVTP